MSPLTKVFVVLLVLSSLVLTSAMVVYVNREADYKKSFELAQDQTALARREQAAALAQVAQVNDNLNAVRIELAGAPEILRKEVAAKDQIIASHAQQIAELNSKNGLQAAEISRLTETVKASQDTQSAQQATIADARARLDEVTKRNTELHAVIADLNNRNDVLNREWRWFKEQLAEAQRQIDYLGKVIKDHGIDLKTVKVTGGPGQFAGAPLIKGVVKDVRPIDGVPYATISVGSADGVIKGMQFKLMDREKGEFLGYLTVDAVEANEASGKLTGPKVTEVKPMTEARTQL